MIANFVKNFYGTWVHNSAPNASGMYLMHLHRTKIAPRELGALAPYRRKTQCIQCGAIATDAGEFGVHRGALEFVANRNSDKIFT